MDAENEQEGRPPASGALHVGIVHGVRSIHFVAVAETRAALLRQLGQYVRGQAEAQLYPDDAGRVASLLDLGEVEAGVRLYFARVGEKWDREWLSEGTAAVSGEGAASGAEVARD